MNRRRFQAIASLSVALILILDAGWQARAQDRQMSYPSMAPLDQYLMDRNAEIALARSAARRPSRAMPKSWFWDRMAMKLPSKARIVSYALWRRIGVAHS